MSDDPSLALFRRGNKFDLPSYEVEGFADRMAELGLLVVQKKTFVRCVNPLDHDQKYIKDSCCMGRVFVRDDLDEDDHAYRCQDCNRVVFPSRKQQFKVLITRTDNEAIRAFIRKALPRVDVEVREEPRGLFRIARGDGDIFVCYADDCRDRMILEDDDNRSKSTVFVVGNVRDFQPRLPAGRRWFSLLDLALGTTRSTFQREIRDLLRVDDRDADRPAVRRRKARVPVATPPATVREEYPGVERVLAPRGTPWSEVQVYLIDGLTLAIRVPGSDLRRFTHEALGMANKRTQCPTKKWEILEKICEGRGTYQEHWSPKEWSALTTQVSELRPLLQHIFGIDADPLPTCSQEEGVKSAFQAFPDTDEPEYVGEDNWLPRPRRQI